MLVRPEAFARNGNHVRLMQQTVGNIDARLQTPTAKICRDVGINVEGTHWSRTTNSRDLSQIGEYLVAQANVIGIHARAARLARTLQLDGACPRRNRALDDLGRNAKLLLSVRYDVHALSAGVLDDVLEGDPIWNWNDDLVAVIHEHLEGIKQRLLASG